MVGYFLLLLFVIFFILMIMDFITTEYLLELGGYEKSPLLKYVAGRPVPHAIVKIVLIIIVFFITFDIVDMLANTYFAVLIMLILILLNLGLIYAQINNIIIILSIRSHAN